MDGKISEQRVYYKIRAQLWFPLKEIHADLQKVYWNGALKYATVCKLVCRFNDGRESTENDPLAGRPVSVLMEKNVATVKTVIEEDARFTVTLYRPRDRRIKWHSLVKCFEDLM